MVWWHWIVKRLCRKIVDRMSGFGKNHGRGKNILLEPFGLLHAPLCSFEHSLIILNPTVAGRVHALHTSMFPYISQLSLQLFGAM
jgi:hypothetical protein